MTSAPTGATLDPSVDAQFNARLGLRRVYSGAFLLGCVIAIGVGVVLLGALVVEIAIDGGATPFRGPSGAGLPDGLGWLAWGFSLAVLAPFVLPRLVSMAGRRLNPAPRNFAALCALTALPAAVFGHLIYVSFEGSYYVQTGGNIIELLGEASPWQLFRIALMGIAAPLAVIAAAWNGAARLRSPSLVWPAIIISAWVLYLFLEPGFLSATPPHPTAPASSPPSSARST